MKGKGKKVVSCILAGALMTTMAGCGKASKEGGEDKGSDIPVVNFCTPNLYDTSAIQSVEDTINGITADKYGVKIKLTYVDFGNWTQQSNMLLTGDEADIVVIYGTPLATYVKNGQLLNLNDYYSNASNEFKEASSKVFEEEDLKCTTIDGNLYAMVNGGGDTIVLNIDEDVAEEYGIEPGQKMSLDELDTFLANVHDKYPERHAIVPQVGSTMMNARLNWDGLGDSDLIGVIPSFGDDTTVSNLFELEEFVDFCEHSRSWYENGYMMADCLSNTETGVSMIASDRAVCAFNNGVYYSDDKFSGNDFHKDGMTSVVIADAKSDTASVSGLCWGISANTKNPDAAWDMMEVLYKDAEVAALLANGIEGENYVVNEDGTASYPEGKDYSSSGYGGMSQYFLYPNRYIAVPRQEDGAGYFQHELDFHNSVYKNQAYGFSFDPANVVDEYSACCNVKNKYYDALMLGAVEPADILNTASEELKAAGLEKVIKEKQTQLDTWLKKQ